MDITQGRYRPYDDHTVECRDCTADNHGETALLPESVVEAHELWHQGPPERARLKPLDGGWPELPRTGPVASRASEGPGETGEHKAARLHLADLLKANPDLILYALWLLGEAVPTDRLQAVEREIAGRVRR